LAGAAGFTGAGDFAARPAFAVADFAEVGLAGAGFAGTEGFVEADGLAGSVG
jgi:hypothetical protein